MEQANNVHPINPLTLAVSKADQEALKALTLDQLADRFTTTATRAKLELGFIILAARYRADQDYSQLGFDNPNQCFGNWVSLKISDTSQQTINNLKNLAEFFTDRSMGQLSVSVGYELAAPKNADKAPALYIEYIESGEKVTVADVRTALGGEPVKPKAKAKPAPEKVSPIRPEPVAEDPVTIRELSLQEFLDLLPPDVAEKAAPKVGGLPSPRYVGLKAVHTKLNASVAKLTKGELTNFKKAVSLLLDFHGDIYDCLASARKSVANQKLEAELKVKLAEAEQAKADYIKGNFISPAFKFHKDEIKIIRSCLHPDRVASVEIRQKAFTVFQRLFK